VYPQVWVDTVVEVVRTIVVVENAVGVDSDDEYSEVVVVDFTGTVRNVVANVGGGIEMIAIVLGWDNEIDWVGWSSVADVPAGGSLNVVKGVTEPTEYVDRIPVIWPWRTVAPLAIVPSSTAATETTRSMTVNATRIFIKSRGLLPFPTPL
jgi:hypothetical protein